MVSWGNFYMFTNSRFIFCNQKTLIYKNESSLVDQTLCFLNPLVEEIKKWCEVFKLAKFTLLQEGEEVVKGVS